MITMRRELAIEQDIDAVARAIYETHWSVPESGNAPPAWDNASDSVKKWVRAQAKSAIAALRARDAISEAAQ